MKTVSILTATRAEYGLLKPVISKLMAVETLDVRIVVTGSHLSSEFGLTYKEIEADGFVIDSKIDMLLSSDSPAAISKSMGLAMISFSDYFNQLKPDLLILLGDRYEALAVATVAMNLQIPIAHLHGGEATEGLIDESIRHSITKMSYLHFTSTETYRKRVIQLGEDPNRVFNVGALGVENIKRENLMTKEELEKSIDFTLDQPYAIVTFHPVTLENDSSETQVINLLNAIKSYKHMKFIFTKGNADANGRVINQLIDNFASENSNCKVYTTLGLKRYLSALKYADLVIGNSSSGIIEVPSFGIPTVNIGDRQKGRCQAGSVINCMPTTQDISRAIDEAVSYVIKNRSKDMTNPYEKEGTSENICGLVVKFLNKKEIDLKKKFYDIEW